MIESFAPWAVIAFLSLLLSWPSLSASRVAQGDGGRAGQLSSPRPVYQVQAAAASQSGRLMLTASSSPIAGNTHRFQPSTAEVNYLPAHSIPASTAITLQDQELCTDKPGQWWPKVGIFLRTPIAHTLHSSSWHGPMCLMEVQATHLLTASQSPSDTNGGKP